MTHRRLILAGLTAGATSLLTSCGTIIYPDRVNQDERGDLDPLILGLDAVGLFFFLIPGIIAFAVDFGTGAIYYPVDHEKGDREQTIFDQIDTQAKLDRKALERHVSRRVGRPVSLARGHAKAVRLNALEEFSRVYRQLTASDRPAIT